MAYLSLNRRWRPRTFGEVTRQEHVTRTLQNAITQGRVAQAYLFGGRRGTGKTTMARLLAMCLNCGSSPGPTAQPCGTCDSCRTISGGSSPDVIELDAASNRGIDEIRTLQENVRLSPMAGRFKVYIIDEAHQMTKDAYNAFLKTLEEPPPHVIFVLATTEPEKILPTVRSRCQRFDFRPVPEPDIAERLRRVAEAEGIKVSSEFLVLVSRKAEGSLRDALGLLEQCVAFAGESPTVDDFLTVTGGLDRDALRKLAGLTARGQVAEVVATLDGMLRAGRDPGAVLSGLIGYLRDVFLARLDAKRSVATGGAGAPLDQDLMQDAHAWTTARLLKFLDRLIAADSDMRYSPQPRLVLEMALLGFALEATKAPQEAVAPAGGAPAPTGPAPAPPGPAPAPTGPAPAPPAPRSATASGGQASTTGEGPPPAATKPSARLGATGEPITLQWFRDNWEDLLNHVRRKSIFARAFLLRATPIGFSDDVVALGFAAKFHKEQMEEERNRKACEEAFSEATGRKISVRCRLVENGGQGAAPGLTQPPPPPRAGEEKDQTRRSHGPMGGPAPSAVPGPAPSATPGPAPGPAARPQPAGAGSTASPSDTIHSLIRVFGGSIVDGEPGPGRGQR